MNEELKKQLKLLKLNWLLENWDKVVQNASQKNTSATRLLKGIITKEVEEKSERARKTRLKRADFPETHVMETYPFEKQPKLNKKKVLEIYDSKSYVTGPHHLALIGPTGVGKTGLSISYLTHAINEGYSGRFVLFTDLIDELYQAAADHSVKKVLRRLLSLDVLVIDELGYCEIDTPAQAGLIFRLLRQRKKSTIITSNLGFEEWNKFLKDPNLTAALIDKFTSNCQLVNMLLCKSITPQPFRNKKASKS
jgi:DNA replication protein DnaC